MAIRAGGRGLFFLGAALSVVGAIHTAGHAPQDMMQVGLLGAAAVTGDAYVPVTGRLTMAPELRKAVGGSAREEAGSFRTRPLRQ
jgi:hypothetical protein